MGDTVFPVGIWLISVAFVGMLIYIATDETVFILPLVALLVLMGVLAALISVAVPFFAVRDYLTG